MRTVMFRERHKQRLVALLLVALCLIFWYYMRGESTSHETIMMPADADDPYAPQSAEGLTYSKRQFFLNDTPFRIISGAMHYFRVPEPYWEDRMKKMKACGLNTLETYVAWNLHEPSPGHYVYSGMLNIRKYIELAHKIGLYVILRPGPYICSEWDYGGMPSWLLRDPNMKVRSNYAGYQEAMTKFFGDLIPKLIELQFSRGGPIIAVQVENEFGSYSDEVEHLLFIKGVLRLNGIIELLVTSDGPEGFLHAPFYNDALPTANFKDFERGMTIFEMISQASADFPLMVMEFWTGWFDHWGSPHNTDPIQPYSQALTKILDAGASVNFYMFHGGTNFGFMAGANQFQKYKPDVTSYDYDAPLSEAGDITEKYITTREILLQKIYKPLGITYLPAVPPNTPKASYEKLEMSERMSWKDLTYFISKRQSSEQVQPMELYNFDSGVGQSYGYIIYRKQIGSGSRLELPGPIHDRAQVLLNDLSVATLDFESTKFDMDIEAFEVKNNLDIIVENLGRVNFANTKMPDPNILNKERKGLSGDVKIDGKFVTDWMALALDFSEDFIGKVLEAKQWATAMPGKQMGSPALFRATLVMEEEPKDTFINMKEWKKGIVIVNGINLGRYWDIGPQRTLFLPAPFLHIGNNEVLVFEENHPGQHIYFDSSPHLG